MLLMKNYTYKPVYKWLALSIYVCVYLSTYLPTHLYLPASIKQELSLYRELLKISHQCYNGYLAQARGRFL